MRRRCLCCSSRALCGKCWASRSAWHRHPRRWAFQSGECLHSRNTCRVKSLQSRMYSMLICHLLRGRAIRCVNRRRSSCKDAEFALVSRHLLYRLSLHFLYILLAGGGRGFLTRPRLAARWLMLQIHMCIAKRQTALLPRFQVESEPTQLEAAQPTELTLPDSKSFATLYGGSSCTSQLRTGVPKRRVHEEVRMNLGDHVHPRCLTFCQNT